MRLRAWRARRFLAFSDLAACLAYFVFFGEISDEVNGGMRSRCRRVGFLGEDGCVACLTMDWDRGREAEKSEGHVRAGHPK